jgi:hypothetical protein
MSLFTNLYPSKKPVEVIQPRPKSNNEGQPQEYHAYYLNIDRKIFIVENEKKGGYNLKGSFDFS